MGFITGAIVAPGRSLGYCPLGQPPAPGADGTVTHRAGIRNPSHIRTHAAHKNRADSSLEFLSFPTPGIIALICRSAALRWPRGCSMECGRQRAL